MNYWQKKIGICFIKDMGKRFLLVLISLVMFAGSAFAYSNPRWFSLPISVYIPKQKEAAIVTQAFKEWQLNSKSAVRFLFRYSANLASISNINVVFVDNVSGDRPYRVNHSFSQFGTYSRGCKNTNYFYNTDVILPLQKEDGEKLSKEQLKAIALQAVGVAVGVNLSEDANSVMYKESDFTKTTLSPMDIQAVNEVYRPTRK